VRAAPAGLRAPPIERILGPHVRRAGRYHWSSGRPSSPSAP